MRFHTRLLGCLLVATAATQGIAAETSRPAFGPPADWVLPPVTELAAPPPGNASVQVLLTDEQVRITTEGVDTYVLTRAKIQSPQGLDEMGTISLSWLPDSDVLTVHQLALLRGEERRDLVGLGENLTVLRREDQLEQAVLTGMLTAVLQPEGLRVGDTIEMSYTLHRRDPVVHDSPDGTYMWGAAPITNARLRVLWPESLPLRWKASSHMPAAEPVRRGGWMDLTYQVSSADTLLQPNGAPLRFLALRMLEVTSFANWQALSKRLAPLYVEASKLGASSPLRAEAARIRREHPTPAARAAAALRLVQDEVRYVLLAMNDGGLRPAPVDETWERRFGDCKAKSVMLLALLRELGIEAEVAAVSTSFGDGMDERLPGVGLFDHVLVRARIGGMDYWLDGTRKGDRSLARLQPPDFRWALPLTNSGSALVQIRLSPLDEPQVDARMHIDASAGIELPAPFRGEFIARSDAAQLIKQGVDGLTGLAREEALRSFWRAAYPGAEAEEVETGFDQETGVLTWRAAGLMQLEWDPDYGTYEPRDMGLGQRLDLSRPRGTDAAAPYVVTYPVYTRSAETIVLPPQDRPFTVTGSDIDRTIAAGEYRRKARVEKNVFTAERTYRSIAPEFPASERATVEKALLEMSRNTLFLKKPSGYLPTVKELEARADQPLESADEYYARAMEFGQRGLESDAEKALVEALELDPSHVKARVALVMYWGRRGHIDRGIRELEQALERQPDQLDYQEALAELLIVGGHTEKAKPLMEALLARRPTASNYLKRAVMLREEDPEASLRDADAAIDADPRDMGPYMQKASLLQELGRTGEIPQVASALNQAHGGDATGAGGAAFLLAQFGQKEAALPYADEELRQRPTAQAYLRRASLHKEKSKKVADLKAALQRPDVDGGIAHGATEVFIDHGWYREAIEALDQYARGHDDVRPQTLGLRGIAYWKLGNESAARKDFAAARADGVGSGLLNNLCWDKATHQVALELALQECSEAVERQPRCAACLDSLGLVLLRLGRLDESIARYDEALAMRPDQAHSLYGRGLARLRKGDREQGQQDIDKARSRVPAVEGEYARMDLLPQ